METAPLTKAHTSARRAAFHPQQTPTTTSEEHKNAAEGFLSATDGVDDFEALRILKMLEEQHRQLANIISGHTERPLQSSPKTQNNSSEGTELTSPSKTPPVTTTSPSATPPRAASPVLQRRPRPDLSSSIASNLASARGIPQDRRKGPAAAGNTNSPSDLTRSRRPDGVRSPHSTSSKSPSDTRRNPEPIVDRASSTGTIVQPQTPASPKVGKDEPFERFYASFGGLLSKLSAPLAFAGLPLTPEEPPSKPKEEPKTQPLRPAPMTRATSQSMHDVTRIFSKAALKAVKDEDPHFAGVQESFMVVPSGGGTVSYANMLRAGRMARRPSNNGSTPQAVSNDQTDQGMGAKEADNTTSRKDVNKPPTKSGPRRKTVEELEIENKTLKQLTDNLSRRVYMWEKSAQSQSVALQQSMRSLPHPPSSEVSKKDREKLEQLEEELKLAKKEIERFDRENEKLKTVVMRYRERWEKLKEGARVRREGQERPGDTAISPS